MNADKIENLLTTAEQRLRGMDVYIDGKMKRYSLLFAVNGGAFAVAKILGTSEGEKVLGGLGLRPLAIGAVVFTVLMWRDIYLFGTMMRSEFFGGRLVFEAGGKRILAMLSLLLIAGWLLVGFWPRS